MDFDASTLVYIIAIIVYFLYSTFFTKKEAGQADREIEQPEAPPRKSVSFDDLLKDIRREQGERERDLEGRPMEEEDLEEDHSYREAVVPTLKRYVNYEDSEQFPLPQASNQNPYEKYKKEPLVKLDDQIDLDSDEKILGEVEDVSGTSRGRNRYASLLKNPRTVRDAVVVSEILRRKHF